MLFERFLDRLIRVGTLNVIDAAGNRREYRGEAGPSLTVRLHQRSLPRQLFLNPSLRAGEAYMDGTLTVEDGSIYGFLDLIAMNMSIAGRSTLQGLGSRLNILFRRLHQFNPVSSARANVAHHYDLSGALYDLFLDADRQYSCAYFDHGGEDLDTAQENKKRHISSKLMIEPNHKVLDIGSGWGGLALHLAKESGADVTGVTLSAEQHKVSQQRARDAGLDERARFSLLDFRQLSGTFDRIVSVGMFEHVGIGHFGEFFSRVRDLLRDDGVALLHTIGRAEGPGVTDPWIRKYIFPGSYIPALSEVVGAVEKSGLWITDIEILRLHYADTLRHWRARFLANREAAVALYDERFVRMWEYYLAVSEISFRYLRNVVFQIQLAKRQETVPLTRKYMGDGDRIAEAEVRARARNGSRAA